MLSRSRKIALVVLPLVLALATAGAIVAVTRSYHDPTLQWTAIAAILTGAALLAALVGLPIALFQLFVVERDIAQLRLVSERHYMQLRGLLERAQEITVGQQSQFEFGDAADRIPLFREAFFAHFPDLARPFATWDGAVGRVHAARESFANALGPVADAVGVDSLVYDRDVILNQLQERTRPSLHLRLEDWADSPDISGNQNGQVAFVGVATQLRGVTNALSEERLVQLLEPLIQLCARVRELPEVKDVANAQDALNGLIPKMKDQLLLYLVTDTIAISQSCPICQRNLGVSQR